jgi:hypothetical protein
MIHAGWRDAKTAFNCCVGICISTHEDDPRFTSDFLFIIGIAMKENWSRRNEYIVSVNEESDSLFKCGYISYLPSEV